MLVTRRGPDSTCAFFAFCLVQMMNFGSWHDMSWPDDWTSTTKDGERSAQFEHCLLVTPMAARCSRCATTLTSLARRCDRLRVRIRVLLLLLLLLL